jgi:hypothetical protein
LKFHKKNMKKHNSVKFGKDKQEPFSWYHIS